VDRKIGIGIDTGGTYTDAVIYDFRTKSVLGTAKALTTRQDLSEGILEALDKLPEELLREAEIISLSTTLATNACVEDKGGRAALVFFGGDEKIVNEMGGKYGLPRAEEMHIQESFTTFSGGVEGEPDWDYFSRSIAEKFSRLDGAGIVEIYAMKNSGVVEKKAREIFRKQFNIPVVCGHELFSELNSLQRGSSTLLNARLFPVIEEFLKAIQKASARRDIKAETVIVRSDGSLMSGGFASVRPVETLLCGPAASIAGGIWLSGEKDCVIADMGGTTTDIALVKNGVPVKAVEGVSIGKWRTFVHGFYIKTLGLGGDSAVHYRDNRLVLEEYRVVPLCTAAASYPRITDSLRELAESHTAHSIYLHEHYLLAADIKDPDRYTAAERRFCDALRNGPLIRREAAAVMDTDIYNLNVSRLLKEGVVQICGFTPTDVMHIKNDFSVYSREASLWGARFLAFNLGISVEDLCSQVYDEVKKKLYVSIVKILLENQDKYYQKNGIDDEAERFILKSYESAKKSGPLVSFGFKTNYSLVGIGAPVHLFLPGVAALLGTRAVVPEHSGVANAIGAVVGNIRASWTADIRPVYSGGGITDYTVFGYNRTGSFRTLKEAEAFAVSEAEAGAREEAFKRGARGELKLTVEINKNEGSARDGVFYMGTAVTASAAGLLDS
jgi:N-methylhydantoinase A/oxoprolinase/acetone carboxylase beta subunit